MTREEKQLLIKDTCARLPYGVKCKLWSYDNESSATTVTIKMSVLDAFIYNNTLTVKPYLRPMSSMTDEERRVYDELACDFDGTSMANSVDWLNENHFDFRNLIEKGLALESPGDMYKTE